MSYASLLVCLLVAAVVVFILHIRRRDAEIGDMLLNAFCYSVARSALPPDTIPRIGVNAFKRAMGRNYPNAKVTIFKDYLTVSYTDSDKVTVLKFTGE